MKVTARRVRRFVGLLISGGGVIVLIGEAVSRVTG